MYYLKELYYKIRDFIRPRQTWLTKHITNEWMDKDVIIETVMFESLKHVIEEEEMFEVADYDVSTKKKRVKRDLLNAYDIITKQIPELQEEKQDIADTYVEPVVLMKNYGDNGGLELELNPKNEKKQKQVIEIDNEIQKAEQRAVTLIAKNYKHMWT